MLCTAILGVRGLGPDPGREIATWGPCTLSRLAQIRPRLHDGRPQLQRPDGRPQVGGEAAGGQGCSVRSRLLGLSGRPPVEAAAAAVGCHRSRLSPRRCGSRRRRRRVRRSPRLAQPPLPGLVDALLQIPPQASLPDGWLDRRSRRRRPARPARRGSGEPPSSRGTVETSESAAAAHGPVKRTLGRGSGRWRPAAAPRRSTYWRMKLNVP